MIYWGANDCCYCPNLAIANRAPIHFIMILCYYADNVT